MKKEIIVAIVIDDNKIKTMISRNGFAENINSQFEAIGILRKVLLDEELKLSNNIKIEENYKVKGILDDDAI